MQTIVRPVRMRRPFNGWLLGCAFLWTLWLQIVMIGALSPFFGPEVTVPGRIPSLVVLALLAAEWLAASLWGRRLAPYHRRSAVMTAATVASSAGVSVAYLAQGGFIPFVWLYPALYVLGTALIPLFLSWCELYGEIGPKLTSISISGALLIQAALFWVTRVLALNETHWAAILLLACMPPLSYLSVVKSWKACAAPVAVAAPAPSGPFRMPVPITALIVAYGTSLGFMLGFFVLSPGEGYHANLVQAMCVGVVAVPLFVRNLLPGDWSMSRSFWPVLLLVLLGFLLLPIVQPDQRYLALDLALAGWAYYRVLMVTVCSEIVRGHRSPAASVFGWDRFANDAGVVLGLVLQGVLVNVLPTFDRYLSTITLVAVIAMVALSAFLLRERNVETLWGLVRPSAHQHADGAIGERCLHIANSHQLTSREREIFTMLAMGRNTDYIRKTLYLSPNTVRSHTSRIYLKLNVHSHQDLIDLVQRGASSE